METLVVGNDRQVLSALGDRLERNGHAVTVAADGQAALGEFPKAELVLLDLDLPDIDGLEVCRRIRDTSDTPIIAFAAGGELDRVLGLQAGADDCLEKPFEFRELLARIHAVMRRVRPCSTTPPDTPVSVGGLYLAPGTRTAQLDREELQLTRKEFDLLLYLASNPEAVLTRSRIMADVWGDQPGHSPRLSRTIDTHVSSLRAKLRDGRWIQTVRGVGFRLGYVALPV